MAYEIPEPCPFCKCSKIKTGYDRDDDGDLTGYVSCAECPATMRGYEIPISVLVQAWNRR